MTLYYLYYYHMCWFIQKNYELHKNDIVLQIIVTCNCRQIIYFVVL